MTCIVGIVEKDKVYIGGDSAGVSNLDITVRKDSKVFTVGDFLIGTAGSYRVMQVMRFSFKPPKLKRGQDIYEFMCTSFVDSMRTCFKNSGILHVKDELHEHDGVLLVGFKGRLFVIYEDFQVGEHIEPWNSIGCGFPYALGALRAMSHTNSNIKSAEEKLKVALSAAAHYSGGVCPPFNIQKI